MTKDELTTVDEVTKACSAAMTRLANEIFRFESAIEKAEKGHAVDKPYRLRKLNEAKTQTKINYYNNAINFVKAHQRNMHKMKYLSQGEIDTMSKRADWTIKNLRASSDHYIRIQNANSRIKRSRNV